MNALCPATVARASATSTTIKLRFIIFSWNQFASHLSPKSRRKLTYLSQIGKSGLSAALGGV